jgi:hypothetical protein
MTCCLGIRKVAQAQVILILMNDQSPPQEVFWLDIGDQITVFTRAFATEFNISQISCMSLVFRAWLRPMILRRAHVKVLTGPLTSFTAQVPRPVNMEAMFALRKVRKGGSKSGFPLFQGGHGMPLNCQFFKDSHHGCHSILCKE